VIEENPLVLIPDKIIPGRTISRPFRENSNLSRTTRKRRCHVSSTRVFEGTSHAISHQRRREGRSPAVLEAPRRELIQQRQRSPAAYPASAGGRRSLCGLLVSNPSSRTPLVWPCPAARCGGTRSFRARCVCRASVAAAGVFRTIIRAAGVASEPPGDGPGRRSRAKDPLRHIRFFTKLTKRRFRGKGAWERVVSQRFAPTDQLGVQIEIT